jgi:ATP-binding cassette subfamily B protein
MILLVISSLVGLATPFLTRIAIDDALPARDLHLLALVVGGMVAVTVATSVFGVLQTWISTLVGQRVMHALRTDVFSHLQRQSLAFFTRTKGGEVQSRLTNDVNAMQSVVTNTATSIATNVTTVAATAIAMAALSWRLSLLSLVVLPPAIWLTRRVALLRRDVTTRQQRQLADMLSQVDEGLTVSGVRLAKTMGAGQAVADRFSVTSSELVDLEVRAQLAGRWRMATMSVIFAIIPALLYLAAGFPATSGGMTIGTLVAFVALQSAVFRPVMGLLNTGVQVVSSMALFSRIFGYLDLPVDVPEPKDPVPVDPTQTRGELRFEDVSYRYPGAETEAVRSVTLRVPAGQSLALVGQTGSGKSTLAGLVARLADPTTGRVTIDGIELRDIAPATLASIVGVVSQETYLLHDSIAANLRFAKPDATDAELWQALGIAQIDDLVASLPAGLDTVVGSRGQRFSGGEQQRLAIARTVLRNPKIIVLDEATSALDNDTERELQSAWMPSLPAGPP